MNRVVKRKPEKPRAAAPSYSVQERFLNQMIEERRKVAVFLLSGVKLEGEIVSYDQYVLLIKGAMIDTVYKHAVSTIQPLAESAARDRGGRGEAGRSTVISRRKQRLIRNPAGDD